MQNGKVTVHRKKGTINYSRSKFHGTRNRYLERIPVPETATTLLLKLINGLITLAPTDCFLEAFEPINIFAESLTMLVYKQAVF